MSPLKANTRPPMRDLILRVCLIALFGMIFWRAFSPPQRSFLTPALEQASSLLQMNNIEKARGIFEEEVRRQPAHPDIYFAVITACRINKKWELAVEYARRGVQECKYASNAERAGLHSVLATSLAEARPLRPQREAIAAAEDALRLAPDDPGIMNLLGYILADNGLQLERARGLISRALESIRKLPDTRAKAALASAIEDSYGWVLFKQGKYPEAIDALNQAIADIPEGLSSEDFTADERKVYYYHLGAACRKADRTEEARRALEMALQYDPEYAEAKAEYELLPTVAAKPDAEMTPASASETK